MEYQAQEIANEIKAELQREVDGVRGETRQIRDLVQDAIVKLSESFGGLRDSSNAQLELVTGLTTSLDTSGGSDKAGGGKKAGVNVRGFIAETDQILRTFVDHIILVSRQSMEMVHRIDELSEQMSEIFSLLKDVTIIAEQTNVLSLNARIVAARAGEAGKAFSVVATEVRKLARGSHEFSDKISAVVGQAKGNIEAARAIIEVMASKDMSFAIEAKGRVDGMMADVSEIDRLTSETIVKVSGVADQINTQVSIAVMSLQFEDMVTQLSQSVDRKLDVLGAFSGTFDVGTLLANEALSAKERIEQAMVFLNQQKAMYDEVNRSAVQQTSMDEGEVELF